MTSRDYIYNRARDHLNASTFPLLMENQVVINAHGLSLQEKEQILYNHIKLGNQPRAFREEIKPYLHEIASHSRFLPETARRLGNRYFTKNLHVNPDSINQFVDKREDFLQGIIQNLDDDSRAALALVYIRNGKLESPIDLQPSEVIMLENLGSSRGGCRTAIEALDGSLTRFSSENGKSLWLFSHPTVGDACATVLVRKRENIEIYLRGVEPERLLRMVTCGSLGIENAVEVPDSLFPLIMDKIDELKQGEQSSARRPYSFDSKKPLFYFLAYRCSKEFLTLYLDQNHDLLFSISRPGLYLNAVPEVPLVIRLHELGLLPDEHRKTFVTTVIDYALFRYDASALTNKRLKNLFTDREYDELIDRLRIELLPRLKDDRIEWEEDFDPTGTVFPDEHMDPFVAFLDSLLEIFGQNQNIANQINNQSDLISDWIANTEMEENEWEEFESYTWQPKSTMPTSDIQSERNIFDDVDADE